MLKKLVSCFLILIVLLSAAACSSSDAPDGMKNVTLDGEPFRLYVPEAWTDNTPSGVSGAYYSSVDHLLVSARYRVRLEGETIELYMEECVSDTATLYGYKLVEAPVTSMLGGKDALKYTYEFNIPLDEEDQEKNDGKEELTVVAFQITAEHKDGFVSLYGYCPKDEYEDRKDTFKSIIDEFKLDEPYVSEDKDKIYEDAPKGMKLASDKDIEYRFFVPDSWSCDQNSSVSEAYLADGSNVTVTSYTPESKTDMTAKEYFTKYLEPAYKNEFGSNYSRTEDGVARKVDGRTAVSYTYTVKVSGKDITIRQTVIRHSGDSTYYTVTYTAETSVFSSHIADVDKMLDCFEFR